MNKLAIATSNETLARDIAAEMGGDFELLIVTTREELDRTSLKGFAALILDEAFTAARGIDVLTSVAHMRWCPVLVLTLPQDPQFAFEAVRAGATDCLAQTQGFCRFLGAAVAEGVQRFREREEARENLRGLQWRISRMEVALGTDTAEPDEKENVTATGGKRELLSGIAALLRDGKIVLPAYPRINTVFRDLVAQGAGIGRIAAELERDVDVAARLVSVANSMHYRGDADVRTVEQALARMSLAEAGIFVEMASSRGLFHNHDGRFKPMLRDLWNHSLAVAMMARETAAIIDAGDPARYFTLGLFHDIGTLLLLRILTELESRDAATARASEAEVEQLIRNQHGRFGSHLLRKWNFPALMCQVAACHEDPREIANPPVELLIVSFANHLANGSGFSRGDPPLVNVKALPQLIGLGLSAEHVDGIRRTVSRLMQERAFA